MEKRKNNMKNQENREDQKRSLKNQELKNQTLNNNVAELFNTISEKDVLFREKDGRWILARQEITEGQLRSMAEEAEFILRCKVWKEVTKCMKYLINRKMFLESRTIEDLTAGKLLLYYLQTLEDVLKTASSLKK